LASIFGHSVVAITLSKTLPKRYQSFKLTCFGVLLSILPDADVIAFNFGIPYSHILGHRGFTHSIFFGLIISLIVHRLFFHTQSKLDKGALHRSIYLSICCASHGLIDAMTSGGRGIALLFPFSYERIFFSHRPILVSPIGAANFFSEWGLEVIISEAKWILIPCMAFLALFKLVQTILIKTQSK